MLNVFCEEGFRDPLEYLEMRVGPYWKGFFLSYNRGPLVPPTSVEERIVMNGERQDHVLQHTLVWYPEKEEIVASFRIFFEPHEEMRIYWYHYTNRNGYKFRSRPF